MLGLHHGHRAAGDGQRRRHLNPVKAVLALALLAALGSGLALAAGLWRVPERWNPWAPLAIEAAPNLLTRYKLQRLARAPQRCLAVLRGTAWRFEPLPDTSPEPGCSLRNAVRVQATQLAVGEAFALSCPSAVALALWEHHVVLPAARRHFGAKPERLEHFGSYACRNLYGRPGAPRSRHASADALDVAGFVLGSGRRVSVARDWHGDDDAARFLHEVQGGACAFFDAVLGPDYNRAHADHLHLDRGPARVCR